MKGKVYRVLPFVWKDRGEFLELKRMRHKFRVMKDPDKQGKFLAYLVPDDGVMEEFDARKKSLKKAKKWCEEIVKGILEGELEEV